MAYQNMIERRYAGWMSLALKELNALTLDIVMETFQ